jgi:hypothetical protein
MSTRRTECQHSLRGDPRRIEHPAAGDAAEDAAWADASNATARNHLRRLVRFGDGGCLNSPGLHRINQCPVVSFVLIRVGLGELRYCPVEGVIAPKI